MSALDVITQPTLDELQLPVDRIRPNPDNVRSDLGDLTDLIESVRTHGVHTPALVYPDGDGWILIAGHRRHAAAIAAGRDTMPAVVREQPDQVTLLELMLSENNQRDPLDPIDEAKALVRIKAAGSYRRLEQIAARVNRSKEWVAGRLRLVQGLPEDLWPAVSAGDVTLGDALKVAGLKVPDAEKRRLFLQPTQIARAVDDDRRARARKEAEAEYGELLAPSEINRIRDDHPWGIIRLGDAEHELNVPIALHRSDCDGHVAVFAFDGVTPTAWCTNPLRHVTDGDLTADIPTSAGTVKSLLTTWSSRQAHATHCPQHRVIDVPWGNVTVCLDPTLHAAGQALDEEHLEELWRSGQAGRRPGEPLQDQPRWSVTEDAEQLLADRLREALAEVPDWILSTLTLQLADDADESVLDLLVRTSVDDLVAELRSAHWSHERLEERDRPAVPALLAGLQACVDVGAPPPNLDEIRTRLDVITRGATEEVAGDA